MKLSRVLGLDRPRALVERAASLRDALTRREADAGRRAVLGGALAAAMPLPALASDAEPHPDAHLLSLWKRCEKAYRALHAARARWEAIPEAIATIETPDVLLLQPQDTALGIAKLAARRADGDLWYFVGKPGTPYPASTLRRPQLRPRRRPVRPEDNLPSDANAVVEMRVCPQAQARADAIVAAWDAYQADIARENEASGYKAAEAALDASDDLASAIEREILAAQAHTAVGLAIKARLVLALEEKELLDEIDPAVVAILRDLIALHAIATA